MAGFSETLSETDQEVTLDAITRTMIVVTANDYNSSQPWEGTATIDATLFTSAFLASVGYLSSNAATLPSPAVGEGISCRINRGGRQIWRTPAILVMKAYVGGGATGHCQQIHEGLPLFPLYPGDQIILSGPPVDDDGTPLADIGMYFMFAGVEF